MQSLREVRVTISLLCLIPLSSFPYLQAQYEPRPFASLFKNVFSSGQEFAPAEGTGVQEPGSPTESSQGLDTAGHVHESIQALTEAMAPVLQAFTDAK